MKTTKMRTAMKTLCRGDRVTADHKNYEYCDNEMAVFLTVELFELNPREYNFFGWAKLVGSNSQCTLQLDFH